jgi:aminoglycoside phosphotransferase (APT) family kinase protein
MLRESGDLGGGRLAGAEVEVRGIDRARVTEWLAAEIGGVTPPLAFELIAGGHSNLTYKLTDAAGRRYVLRRPPLGAVLATAHDMAREHRIISAIGKTAVPVPPALGLCEDEAVNGAPFYVMEYVEGQVLVDGASAEKLFGEEERYRIGCSVIQVLADLHRLDPDEIGLGDLGRKEAYLARQLKRWQTQWEKSKTRELPAMEEVHEALVDRMPEQVGATVVHGDYRLGNMLIGRDARVAALLDWELCTLGDPMADVGYVMNNWAEPGEGSATMRGAALAPTMAGGFPDREAFLARYVELTGRDVSQVDYYRAFQYWRLAAIIEGVLARYLKGVMGTAADTEAFRSQVDLLAGEALALVRRI